MMMSEFIGVVCEGNTPPHNWQDIFQEYIELIKDERSLKNLYLERDINFLEAKIWYVEIAIALLGTDQHERAKSWLSNNGYRDTSRAASHLKTLRIQLKQKRTQLPTEAEKGMTAADFEANLVALSKHNNGMDTNPKNISVARYCAMVTQIEAEVKSAQQPNGTKGRN